MNDAPTLALQFPDDLPTPDSALADTAHASIQALIDNVGSGRISQRQAERISRIVATVRVFGEHVARIVEQGCAIGRASATTARDVERLATDIAAFRTTRDEHALRTIEIAERKKHLPGVIEQETRVRKLTAEVAAEELDARLAVVRRQREADSQRIEDDRTAGLRRGEQLQAHRLARVETARKKTEECAARITRDVQIGSVPTGAKQPFHAFAACVYLAAKLDDGCSSDEAAARTREAVIAQMAAGEPLPEEIDAYRAAFQDLKQRAQVAARRHDASEILKVAETFTGGVQ
jgi:hypothetical protein